MQSSDNNEIKRILERQSALMQENNRLLKKVYRYEVISFWSKILWLALLIGVPFALYYYILEPYFSAFGASYDAFNAGMQEIPGLKYFTELLNQYQQANGGGS